MKVIDLMIDDWIHNNYTNKNYQVWRTFFSQATNYAKRLDATLEDVNIAPIPLTDEILKVNGFKYFHKNFAALNCESPFQLEMVEWPNEEGIGLWMLGNLIKICYVHELQHALKLCGIKKEIVL